MKNKTWQTFWKKNQKSEWTQEDVLEDNKLKYISKKIETFFVMNIKDLDIIEIGAGRGLCSYYFGNVGAEVTLLDNSAEAKKLAKEFWGKIAHNFVVENLFEYSGKFDVCISVGVCEHFEGEMRIEVLKKHIGLLNKRGIAIIGVPYKYSPFYRMSKFIAERLGLWNFGKEIPYSKKEFKNFCEEHNLEYEIIMDGFCSSVYHSLVRQPLKLIGIKIKRRFVNTKSIWDNWFGMGLTIIIYKKIK